MSPFLSINSPPKLSHFIRHAFKRSMAVNEELCRRHIVSDTFCGCCGLEKESINHVLFNCNNAQVV